MKKTKIICSIGPASSNWEVFKGLVEAGMNVVRINFSHATTDECDSVLELVHRANTELNANIGIMYDTKGPDLRTLNFEGDLLSLEKDSYITITEEEVLGNKDIFSVNYKDVLKNVPVGSKVLLDDGFYELEVVENNITSIKCLIKNSGEIKNRRGVCIPGVKLNIPFISEQDMMDIEYACKNEGNFLALSFVNSKDDVLQARLLCNKFGRPDMQIVSKVESQYAMDHLEEIVDASDYIMVARGDLGIETGVENLPLYQKRMIDLCHANSKGVIMATQMMHSMKTNIRPTNAEVTDVGNAILLGCDAIMTSDETTIGNYPVETIEMMTKICLNVEEAVSYNHHDYKLKGTDIHNTIATCSVSATNSLDVKAVIVSTLHGTTAWDISSFRPRTLIVATTPSEMVARSLSLKWGVYTKIVPMYSDMDTLIKTGIEACKEFVDLKQSDKVVIVGSSPITEHTNFMKIEIVQ